MSVLVRLEVIADNLKYSIGMVILPQRGTTCVFRQSAYKLKRPGALIHQLGKKSRQGQTDDSPEKAAGFISHRSLKLE